MSPETRYRCLPQRSVPWSRAPRLSGKTLSSSEALRESWLGLQRFSPLSRPNRLRPVNRPALKSHSAGDPQFLLPIRPIRRQRDTARAAPRQRAPACANRLSSNVVEKTNSNLIRVNETRHLSFL